MQREESSSTATATVTAALLEAHRMAEPLPLRAKTFAQDPPVYTHHHHHHSHPVAHDLLYYSKCAVGGACASTLRLVFTPLEVLKGYNQVGLLLQESNRGVTGIARGIRSLWLQEGFSGLFKGMGPTAMAYALQTGTKYSLYECFKDHLFVGNHNNDSNSMESLPLLQDHSTRSNNNRFGIVAAAACAEICASILMCPWEQVRVKIQTSAPGTFPTSFKSALTVMIERRVELRFPFGGLGPLWARQVPGTIVNLYTFETTVQAIYRHCLNQRPKESYSISTQLSVTLLSGYIAGFACAVVSHIPDSLLSLMSQPQHQHLSFYEIINKIGWKQLATRGLAPRVITIGTIIGGQWWIYDTFKTIMGMGTTGG